MMFLRGRVWHVYLQTKIMLTVVVGVGIHISLVVICTPVSYDFSNASNDHLLDHR